MATITAEGLKKKFNNNAYGIHYADLVHECCGELLANQCIGDWQGDEHFLVKRGDEYAHVVLGYGSCSHCDTLQACQDAEDPFAELAEYANDVAGRIMWRTKDEIMTYLKEHDAEGSWYGGGEDWKQFQKECFDALKA